MVSPDHINSPPRKGAQPIQDPDTLDNKQHELSLLKGMLDKTHFPIDHNDYYSQLGALGFYSMDIYPTGAPWIHDINTTSTLHYYDTSKKKTPIDLRVETMRPHLGHAAEDYQKAELYNVQDFEANNTRRIQEKTHRIQADPTRKFQSQVLIDIQNQKALMKKGKNTIPITQQLLAYSQMQLDVNTLLLERITDVLDYQEKILMFQKHEQRPACHNFYMEMTLTANAEATKIDFRNPENNRNIPGTAIIVDPPKHNLMSLQILFDTGNQIQFANNRPTNSLETTIKMKNPPEVYNLTPTDKHFTIESLNIRAIGTNAEIRLIGLY